MRHRLVIPVLVALLSLAGATASQAVRKIEDGLELTFNADFVPHRLPRLQAAPVKIHIQGKIATTDGSHPPPLHWIEIALNRNGRLDAEGLPTCTAPLLQSTSTSTALSRCRSSLVGQGRFRAVVSLGREIDTGGKILAFNSRRGGRQALVLHLFGGSPVRFTLVVPLTIEHLKQGGFGTLLRAKVPKLAGGLGSVTEIDLTIGRRYSFRGVRHSYVSAACSAPPEWTEVPFVFARGTFRFEGHKELRESLEQVCQVR
jgi:hypothetical protein